MTKGVEIIDVKHGAIGTLTANGTGDATMLTSVSHDAKEWQSGKVFVNYTAALGSGETLDVDLTLRHSLNGSSWTEIEVLDGETLATGPSGGGTVTGSYEHVFARSEMGNYISALITPDLSRSGTDTARVALGFVFGDKIEY